MLSTNLVLVEGLPGAGKSATTHRLARALRRQGPAARWYAEEEVGHPTNVGNADDLDRFAAETIERWRRLVPAVQAVGEVWLLEGSLLQSGVRVLFHRGAAPERIVAFARELEAALAPLDPLLVHLRRPDVARALRRVCDQRGPRWEQRWVATITSKPYARRRGLAGFAGAVRYWQDYQALVDGLLAGSRLTTLDIDTSGEAWAEYLAAIAAALGVAPTPEPAPPPWALARLPGRYRADNGHEVAVRRAGDGLFVDNFLFATSRLLPAAGATFEVEGWPLDLTFEADAAGAVRRARIGGRDVEFVALVGSSLQQTGPASD